MAIGRVADAVSGHWVDTGAPMHWRPYLRLMRADRPIGWWLLLLPCWQSLALAIGATEFRWIDLWLPIAFLIGAVAMRGAGCTLNDIVDRDFDASVQRTRSRPIPSGAVTVKQAAVFMAALCAISLLVLLTMNSVTIVLCFASLAIVAVYPFAKRFTNWPQVILGLAFNWGALVGWTAHTGYIGVPALMLYCAGIAWTVAYDTIYAHQDKEDDLLIGVKSTAIFFGEATHSWLSMFFGAALIFTALAGAFAGLGFGFWLGFFAYAGHFVWQLLRLDIEDPDKCLRLFRSNRDAGLILLGAIMLGGLF